MSVNLPTPVAIYIAAVPAKEITMNSAPLINETSASFGGRVKIGDRSEHGDQTTLLTSLPLAFRWHLVS